MQEGQAVRLTEDKNSAKFQITAYTSGCLVVNDHEYRQSLILTPEQLITDWPVTKIHELSLETLQPILDLEPQVILIGCGEILCFPDQSLRHRLMLKNIALEVMDNGACCRTYCVLSAEQRNVAAGIILPR